jgi:hypothetical protein
MKITVAGVGYVGLSLAVLFSQHHEVTAITTTEGKVGQINRPSWGSFLSVSCRQLRHREYLLSSWLVRWKIRKPSSKPVSPGWSVLTLPVFRWKRR